MNIITQNKTKTPRTIFWWLFLTAGSIAAVGFIGLLLGLVLFPRSNLLGGFGLIFGPIWGLGVTLLAVVTIGWLIARIYTFITRKRT
ncbi:MAG: hypothetical protein ACXWIU_02530 [Limisphaerales bacterium]